MATNETKPEVAQEKNTEKTNCMEKMKGIFNGKCCGDGECKHKKYVIGAIILLLIIGYAVYGKKTGDYSLKKVFTKSISKEEAKVKIKDFIEKNLVQPGTKIEIKSITEENGLYKLTLTIEGQTQEITSYLSKDGKMFFPQAGMDIAKIESESANKKEVEAPKEIPKNDKPAVDLYVMSFCPYGNKAEDTMKPVYDLLKNKVDFNVHYIVDVNGNDVQSLHGAPEVAQNEREACVLKNYGKDKWFAFTAYVNKNCGNDGACWEAGAKSLGIDKAKISSCVTAEGVALMKANAEASKKANASGSPTMTINGVSSQAVYQYGNSEAYKQAICGAFNTAPAECAKKLSAAAPATAGAAPAQGGSCGN